MLPLPPLRFSMMTGWPHFACNLSPTMRASTSLVPPPGYGTRNFTGLVGYPSCANALLDPGGRTIDRMKMKAKAAGHRTMGVSVGRGPRIQVTRMPRPHQSRSRAEGRCNRLVIDFGSFDPANGVHRRRSTSCACVIGGDANDFPT